MVAKSRQSIDRLTSMSGQVTSLKTQLESDVKSQNRKHIKTETVEDSIKINTFSKKAVKKISNRTSKAKKGCN